MKRIVLLLIGLMFLGNAMVPAFAQAGAASPSQAESARATKIKSDLQAVLNSGEYQREKPGESWMSRAGKWISERWNSIAEWFRKIFGFSSGVGSGSATIMPYVLVVGLILLLAYGIAYAMKNYSGERGVGQKKPKVDTILEPEETAAAEPDAWIDAAKRHAASGDYRRAYRAVFIAILIRMDRIGALKFERSKTNGDYVRTLRDRPALLLFLRPLANDFDARWYGHIQATEADFQKALDSYNRVPGSTT